MKNARLMASAISLLGSFFMFAPFVLAAGTSPTAFFTVTGAIALLVGLMTKPDRVLAAQRRGVLSFTHFLGVVQEAAITAESFDPVVQAILAMQSQESTNSTERATQLGTLDTGLSDLSAKFDTSHTNQVAVQSAINSLIAQNNTNDSAINANITNVQSLLTAEFSTLGGKADAIQTAIDNTKVSIDAFAAQNTADLTGLNGAVVAVEAKLVDLKTSADAINASVNALASNVATADSNNVTGLASVQTAIADLKAANQADSVAVQSNLSAIETAINDTKTQNNTNSVVIQGKLDGINASVQAGKLSVDMAVTELVSIGAEISGFRTEQLQAMNDQLAAITSEYKAITFDWENPDATSEVIIATIPKSIVFSAIMTEVGSSTGILEVSMDDGATWKPLARGVGASPQNLHLSGHDVGEYPALQVKYPIGSKGFVQATSEGTIDVQLIDSSGTVIPSSVAGGSSAPVAFTVTDNGTDSAFAAYAGDYTDTGEVSDLYGGKVYTNGVKFAVEPNVLNGEEIFAENLADAKQTNGDFVSQANGTITTMNGGNVVGSYVYV